MRRPVIARPAPAAHRTALAAVAAATLLLVGSACSSGQERQPVHADSAAPKATASTGHRPSPSVGCFRTTPPRATGRYAFGGRSYLLKRPNNDGRTAAPLILDFHGLRSTAFTQAVYGRMSDTGAARGFIVVEPESVPARRGWKLPGMRDGTEDIAYVRTLLDHLESTLCVDTSREYATGMSNGAGLATALICGLDGRLAGVAPVAGLNLARPCEGAPPTTIVAFHGTADRIVPYRGGEPFSGDRRQIPAWMRPSDGVFALPAVPDLATRWARAFGCGTGSHHTTGPITRLTHPGCRGGVRVDLYTVTDGGHTWPGSLPLGIGSTTTRIDATKIILDTFTAPSR